jgi:hypothetical protein
MNAGLSRPFGLGLQFASRGYAVGSAGRALGPTQTAFDLSRYL